MNLYFIEGLRHSAIVIANTEKEAIERAIRAGGEETVDEVLWGDVGAWEMPTAYELKLPKGIRLVAESS